MPWAQKLVEAEDLSVVSLIGGHWQTGREGSGFSSSPPAFPSLQTQQQGVQCCFPLKKRGFFSSFAIF